MLPFARKIPAKIFKNAPKGCQREAPTAYDHPRKHTNMARHLLINRMGRGQRRDGRGGFIGHLASEILPAAFSEVLMAAFSEVPSRGTGSRRRRTHEHKCSKTSEVWGLLPEGVFSSQRFLSL